MLHFNKLCAVVAATLCSIGAVSAQDVIVLNNPTADEIEAKVQEVKEDVVTYKRWDYQDGPTFSVAVNEIFVIKYANGTKQSFADVDGYGRPTRNNWRKTAAGKRFKPGFGYYTAAGYLLGVADDASMCTWDFTAGYRFTPYTFVGGTVGACVDTSEAWVTIPVMATFRADAPIGRKCTFFGQASAGVSIATQGDGDTASFMCIGGPGVSLHGFMFSVNYAAYGSGGGGVLFRLGYSF